MALASTFDNQNKMIDSNSFLVRRGGYLAGFLICAALMAYAFYLQYALDMEPCPLCMFQRVALSAMGGLFLIAALHGPGRAGAWGYALVQLVVGGIGIALASRHLYIQSLPPDQVPACGMGIGYMLDTLPLGDVIMRTLKGSGECAHVDLVLGLSIPAWTLILFVLLIAGAFVLAVRNRR